MARTTSGNGERVAVVQGDGIDEYPWMQQKREHEALIIDQWGQRCDTHSAFCGCCVAWDLFDRYWSLMQETCEGN
jgi:hypothetical protein